MDVDEKSFASVIFGVIRLEFSGPERLKRIVAVHRLVGVKAGRGGGELVETEEAREDENNDENNLGVAGHDFIVAKLPETVE